MRGNVINTEPDPEHVKLGMKVRLTTVPVGTDDDGHRGRRLRLRTHWRRTDGSDDVWILGIHMTKFGKHPDKDVIDLAAEAARAR